MDAEQGMQLQKLLESSEDLLAEVFSFQAEEYIVRLVDFQKQLLLTCSGMDPQKITPYERALLQKIDQVFHKIMEHVNEQKNRISEQIRVIHCGRKMKHRYSNESG